VSEAAGQERQRAARRNDIADIAAAGEDDDAAAAEDRVALRRPAVLDDLQAEDIDPTGMAENVLLAARGDRAAACRAAGRDDFEPAAEDRGGKGRPAG